MLILVQALSLLGILNWACGGRSFLGRPLALRRGPFWVGCRCFGAGLFVCLLSVRGVEDAAAMPLWVVCAVCLLVGSARVRGVGRGPDKGRAEGDAASGSDS